MKKTVKDCEQEGEKEGEKGSEHDSESDSERDSEEDGKNSDENGSENDSEHDSEKEAGGAGSLLILQGIREASTNYKATTRYYARMDKLLQDNEEAKYAYARQVFISTIQSIHPTLKAHAMYTTIPLQPVIPITSSICLSSILLDELLIYTRYKPDYRAASRAAKATAAPTPGLSAGLSPPLPELPVDCESEEEPVLELPLEPPEPLVLLAPPVLLALLPLPVLEESEPPVDELESPDEVAVAAEPPLPLLAEVAELEPPEEPEAEDEEPLPIDLPHVLETTALPAMRSLLEHDDLRHDSDSE